MPDLEIYGLTDQPTTCPRCGCRTDFDQITHGAGTETPYREKHTCNNPSCGFEFIAEEDEEVAPRNPGSFTTEKFVAAAESRWEEIDFMMDQHISAVEIARRLNTTPSALSRQAYRYGWTERARRFNFARSGAKRKSRAKPR